jgi:antitoxin component YwqK of YwqJK toxin-antitoxin module
MIRQEARIDKTTGVILEFKEYNNNELILTERYDDKGELIYKRTLKEEETYHMGKLHGDRIIYFDNGSHSSKSTFENGEIREVIMYYPNGQIDIRGTYLNKELHGEVFKYHPDGQLEYKRTYENGKQIHV